MAKFQNLTISMMCMLYFLCVCGVPPARADNPELDIKMDVRKEVKTFRDNKWLITYAPVDDVKQGDILRYTITYTNTGDTAATDAVIIDPIPKETVYVIDSAAGENTDITYSVNNGKNYQAPPVKYTVRKPDGADEKIIAPPDMYTHIKWKVNKPLSPGRSGLLEFKVIVK